MRKAIILAGVLLAFSAMQVAAQSPMLYDPFVVLPGSQGSMGIDAGINAVDIGEITDMGDAYVAGKYSVTDKIEVGARITAGILNSGRDSLSDIVIGAKCGLTPSSAVTANVAVYNEIEEIGVSAGYMQTMQAGGLDINVFAQVGVLDGYAPDGISIDLDIQPKFEISEQVTGYVDVLFKTNTDDIGDTMALDLWPNIDYVVSDALIVNGGVTVGVAGDSKQDDVGIRVAAIYLMP